VRRVALAVAVVLAAVTPAPAADDSIEPDRPDVTNGAKTVGAGRIQVESGVFYGRERRAPMGDDRDRRDDRRLAVETTVRVGVTGSLELRLEAEPYVRLRGFDEEDGHGDFNLSAKWRFFETPEGAAWPSLALVPFVKLPVTEEPIGSGKTDAGVTLVASFDLPGGLGLDANAGVAVIGQSRPGGSLVQARASASVSREIVEGLATFGEVFYGSRDEWAGGNRVGLDAGLVWKVARTLALDVAAGTLVHGSGPDWFVRAGVSVRFGR
jgi:hypothetical protein